MKKKEISLLSAAVLAISPPVCAQQPVEAPIAVEPPANDTKVLVPESLEEFFGPSTPTFSLIGAADSTIIRPESPKDVAGALLNGLDDEGNLKSGLAIEFAPFLIFAPADLSLKKYNEKRGLARSLTNLQVSMGFAIGTSDKDKSLKASLGLVWTPINGRDVYASDELQTCLTKVGAKTPTFVPDATTAETVLAARKAEVGACHKKNPIRRDNTTTLQFAFAPLFVSPDGTTGKLRSQGFATSGTLMLGLSPRPSSGASESDQKKAAERRAQLIATMFYRKKEQTPDPAVEGNFLTRDRWSAATRFQFSISDKSFIGIEAAYQRAKYTDGRVDKFKALVGTYDIKIIKSVWLGLNIGTSFDKSIGKEAAFIGTKFRWSFKGSSDQGGLYGN